MVLLSFSMRLVFIRNGLRFQSSGRLPSDRVLKSSEPSAESVIDENTIKHLERLSLVDFANKRGIVRLEEAIKFAEKLDSVDTTNVEPLVSVLENEALTLREDLVTEQNDVKLVMSSACLKEEDYYIAPPGNIPLISRDPTELK